MAQFLPHFCTSSPHIKDEYYMRKGGDSDGLVLTYVFLEALQNSGYVGPPPELARALVLRQVHQQPRPQPRVRDPLGQLPVSVLPAYC